MFDPFFIRDSPNQDVVKKMFLYFCIFARSDPPDVFSLAASGQGKLCN